MTSGRGPKDLVATLGLKAGMSVADIGTGVGYMLPFLHEGVGDKGQVYAEDIFDDFLKQAKERAAANKLTNVTFIKGPSISPTCRPTSWTSS